LRFKLAGVVVPMVTPFREDETLDEEALRRSCDRLVGSGVDGLFPVGSTGEFYALRDCERRRVLQVVVEQCAGRVPVFAGASGISTGSAAEFAREAEELGADAVVVLTPFYINPTQDELYDHFRSIAEATGLPVLPYNNPTRTAVNLAPETVARLAEIRNVVGIKDSSGNLAQTSEYIAATPGVFAVFQGQDSIIAASLSMGVVGAVPATANVAPDVVVGLYRAFLAGNMEACKEAQRKLAVLRKALQLGTFPVVFKEAMAMVGFPVGPARRPCAPLDDVRRRQLRRMLEGIGLLEVRPESVSASMA